MLTFDVYIFIISFYNNIMKKNYYNEKEKKIKYLSLMKIIHMLKVNK